MTRLPLAAAFLILAGLSSGCGGRAAARAAQGERVEAEGWAPNDDADPIGTRRRALADAERKAVEKVVGVSLTAKTRVDNDATVQQRVMAEVQGHIVRYEVIGEKKEDGFWKTRIRAWVLRQAPAQTPPGPARPELPGLPTLAVALHGPKADTAARSVRAALSDKGFTVLDSTAAVDLLVTGEASLETIPGVTDWLVSERATLSLQAVKRRSGETLATETKSVSAIDPAASAAATKAADLAGSMAGEELADALAGQLKGSVGVLVVVDGLSTLGQAQAIADDIELNPGVTKVAVTDFHDGSAQLRVTTDDIPGADLSAMILRNRKLNLTASAVSAYEVRLSAK